MKDAAVHLTLAIFNFCLTLHFLEEGDKVWAVIFALAGVIWIMSSVEELMK